MYLCRADLFAVIQGMADVEVAGSRGDKNQIASTIEHCMNALQIGAFLPREHELLAKIKKEPHSLETSSDGEVQILEDICFRYVLRKNVFNIDGLKSDVIDGMTHLVERGRLGLLKA